MGESIANLKSKLESRVRWCIQNPKKFLSTTEFNLKLYLGGELYHDEILVEESESRTDDVLVIIKLDFHNESNVIFQEKSNIALILPKWLCVKNVSQGKQQDMYISNDPQFSSIVSFKNGLRLHPIGTFDALLPEEWYSIFFFLSIDKLFAEYVARLRENNFSAVHSFIVRIFTALGPKDFPLRLRLRPAVEP